jgi:hypothetical protein
VTAIRRTCFISYHTADVVAVNAFIDTFGSGNFIKRGITMPDEVVGSNDTDYVMRRIRELYVKNSTVTIALIGKCTWARRFVDWEVQASLRRPAGGLPNGLIAILLDNSIRPALPARIELNRQSGYADYHYYPSSAAILGDWIEAAHAARTEREHLRRNPGERYSYNRSCS